MDIKIQIIKIGEGIGVMGMASDEIVAKVKAGTWTMVRKSCRRSPKGFRDQEWLIDHLDRRKNGRKSERRVVEVTIVNEE